jgi:hypothetical protein
MGEKPTRGKRIIVGFGWGVYLVVDVSVFGVQVMLFWELVVLLRCCLLLV